MTFEPLLVDYNKIYLDKGRIYRSTNTLIMPIYRSLQGGFCGFTEVSRSLHHKYLDGEINGTT